MDEVERQLRVDWGAAVRRRREQQNLSQQALAEALRVSVNTISRIERGVFSGSERTRMDLARKLGCEVHELFAYPSVLATEAAS